VVAVDAAGGAASTDSAATGAFPARGPVASGIGAADPATSDAGTVAALEAGTVSIAAAAPDLGCATAAAEDCDAAGVDALGVAAEADPPIAAASSAIGR
jgi:hypothetical protein